MELKKRYLVCSSETDFWCAPQLWRVAQKVESVRSLAPPPDSCGNAADDDDDDDGDDDDNPKEGENYDDENLCNA